MGERLQVSSMYRFSQIATRHGRMSVCPSVRLFVSTSQPVSGTDFPYQSDWFAVEHAATGSGTLRTPLLFPVSNL